MSAVVEIIGKQFFVKVGDRFLVDRIQGEAETVLEYTNVLVLMNGEETTVGTPYVANASVQVKIVKQCRGKKLRIVKHKRRKHYKKTQGHKQDLTLIEVTEIIGELAQKAQAKATTKEKVADKPKATAKEKVADKPKTADRAKTIEEPKVAAKVAKKPMATDSTTKTTKKESSSKETSES